MVANQQWDSLGRILTSPDGLKTMENLATTPAAIRNWRLLIAPLFVGGNKMEDKEAIQKKYENALEAYEKSLSIDSTNASTANIVKRLQELLGKED